MESGSYKEFDAKPKSTKLFAIVFTAVTILLCTFIGFGTWFILFSAETAIPVEKTSKVVEEIIVIENPSAQAQISKEVEKIVAEPKTLNNAILEEVNDAIKQDEAEFSNRANNNEYANIKSPFIRSLVELSNNVFSEIIDNLPENNPFVDIFNPREDSTQVVHSRKRRSIMTDMGLRALQYLNYLSFGRFMYNEVYSITEYAVEGKGRKLSGDFDTMFLDGVFWPTQAKSTANEAVEKIDNEEGENSSNSIVQKPDRPASAYDDGWTPMVNQVSLQFITEMLTTLLNLMREYLMKDHVMECLWFMFCKDMNHQAKYTDPMGYLARVNSVGLKVLVDREGRETDTVSSVWQALTQWEALECDVMFPRCDGSKALEIVNEVATASR